MPSLTQHQQQALSQYRQMMADYPDLFLHRKQRPIVQDFSVLEAYAKKHNIVLGVAAATPYSRFIVDLVESQSADGSLHCYPYQRLISASQLKGGVNVVVLATIHNPALGNVGNIILMEEERHATGSREQGLPRGFGEAGLTGEQNALKELREETGYVGEMVTCMGSAYIDSGVTDSKVFFYHVGVTDYQATPTEKGEIDGEVLLVSLEDIWKSIRTGLLRDSFTLQALALFERQRVVEKDGTRSSKTKSSETKSSETSASL